MNQQSVVHVFKREEEPVRRLWATHINKGKSYPYMPASARAAMIKSELEKQARGTPG